MDHALEVHLQAVRAASSGNTRNGKAVYVALAINASGEKEVLGLWIGQAEGARFWLDVFTELKRRGVQNCFVACADGLKDLPEAIETAFPQIQVQGCIVRQKRNSLKFVAWKERKVVRTCGRSTLRPRSPPRR